ncbi:MAG: hypothetical protein HY451_01925 [Parcubacteria group bacterium]|nr:hypothetical protein [Parcubacteria group bacterium]
MKKLFLIFIFSFLLNWIWENLHSVLYYHPGGELMTQGMLLNAALFDAVFITALALFFIKISYLNKRLWLSLIFGLAAAVFIELRALEAGRWAYTSAMPVIPLLNIGLTPFVQLGLLSYFILKSAKI